MTQTHQATTWHTAPEGAERKCPICTCPLRKLTTHKTSRTHISHRATGENQWEKRCKSPKGWKITTITVTEDRTPRPRQIRDATRVGMARAAAVLAAEPDLTFKTVAARIGVSARNLYDWRRDHKDLWTEALRIARAGQEASGLPIGQAAAVGVPESTQQQVREATALLAAGLTYEEASDELGIAIGTLRDWRIRYPNFWEGELNRAMQFSTVVVRTQAGTDAVIDDPEAYLRRARGCEKWLAAKGESLFPSSGEPTVSSFFQDWYLPNRLFESPASTITSYRNTVRFWSLITGDPPLKEITSELVAKFRDCLAKKSGAQPGLPASPNTVRTKLRHLQCILDKAGPPGRRNRDAVGIIDRAPYAKPPRPRYTPRTIVSMERVIQVYEATVAMHLPKIDGFKAPWWWKTLLLTALYTGLRRGTLFSMQMREILWDKHLLAIAPERLKSRRPQIVPLHPIVEDHLRRIRTDRELVFPWPNQMRAFHSAFHELQSSAGIPRAEHFGLHALRRSLATMLWDINPGAAQLGLGHAGTDVTKNHYVRPDDILIRAFNQLPQPEAFQINGNGHGKPRHDQTRFDTPSPHRTVARGPDLESEGQSDETDPVDQVAIETEKEDNQAPPPGPPAPALAAKA